MSATIYLDYNATTPIAPEAFEAMLPYLIEHFGNPSSGHSYGTVAKQAIETARTQVAAMLGASGDEIVFTGGGTEANNFAIRGVAMALRDKGRHLVTTAFEHPAVIEVMEFLKREGWQVTYVPVGGDGTVDPAEVERAMRPDTVLVSAMHANNEVGSILPIRAIADIAHARGALMHCDAAQSLGKIPVRVPDLGVDLLSIAGHKLYAPKGVGALYIKKGTPPLTKLMFGAAHEADRRPGTENTPYLVALGAACKLAMRTLKANAVHYAAMRDRLQARIFAALPQGAVRLNGPERERLPNTLNIGFDNVEADALLRAIPEIAASTGAACHAGAVSLSLVLRAMNVPMRYAKGTVRLTTGRGTTAEEVDRAADLLTAQVRKMQGIA